MRLSRTHAAVLGLVMATTLGGCGGSAAEEAADTGSEATPDTDQSDGPSEETAPEEPEEVTIERAEFCDRIDTALIEGALGAPSRWLEERTPGQTYEIFGQKQKSENFYCRWQTNKESEDYGADDATLGVTIHGKPATPAFVDAEFAERAEYLEESGKETGCEEVDATFGDRSWSEVCTFKGDQYNDPNSSASVLGVFGDSLVSCYVQRNGPGESAQVRSGIEDMCSQLPTALGSSR